MKWIAWYTEGRVFSSSNTTWTKLPSSGLLWVTVFKETGRTFYNGGDWYWLEEGEIKYIPSEEWGTNQEAPFVLCQSCLKQGVGVSDPEWLEIQRVALNTINWF